MPATSTSDTAPRSAAPDMRSGPLAGVRILDMATVVAAPFACTLCADLGAEVVKLELPDGSDALRTLAPVKGGHALYWKVTNRGKRGITLDVRKAEGRALLLRLLPQFDVLVENFRTGTLERWGLDLATLQRANPQLTVLRLTGFGQTGPYAARPGFARIFEAMSGFAHLTGEADGRPHHMNSPLGDMVAGLFGAFSIAAAVADRRAHPRECGREIDLSATEAMLRMLEPLAAEFEQLGQVRCRAGSRAPYPPPRRRTYTAPRTSAGSRWWPRPSRFSGGCARPWAGPRWPAIRALAPASSACCISMRSTAPSSAGAPRWLAPNWRRCWSSTRCPLARSTPSMTCSPTRICRRAKPSSACPTRTWASCPRPAPCRAFPALRRRFRAAGRRWASTTSRCSARSVWALTSSPVCARRR